MDKKDISIIERSFTPVFHDKNQTVDLTSTLHPLKSLAIKELEIVTDKDKKESKKDKFVVSSIDCIYSNIRTIPKYIRNIIFIICFIGLINETLIWNIRFMFMYPRQFYYCYNTFSKSLEFVEPSSICTGKQSSDLDFIYVDSGVYNQSFVQELSNINNLYLKFFYNQSELYYKKKSEIIMVKSNNYTGCLINTELEKTLFSNKFFQICKVNQNLFLFSAVAFMGNFIGNSVFAFLSDLFGRKNIFISGLFSSGIGSLGIFFSTQLILSESSEAITSFETKNNVTYNYLNDDYDLFIRNIKYMNLVIDSYSELKLFFCIFIFLANLGYSLIYTNGLCLTLEYSVNDQEVHSNFFYYHSAISLSFFVSYIFNTKISHSFEYSYGICGIFLIIFGFSCIFYMHDSPRQCFEFYDFAGMTNVFNRIIQNDEIDKFYQSASFKDKIIELELKYNEKRRATILRSLMRKQSKVMMITYYKAVYETIKLNNTRNQPIIFFSRNELLESPVLLFKIMFYERKIRDNFLFCLAIIQLISSNYFIVSNSIISRRFLNRNNLYNNHVYNTPPFFNLIVVFISNYLFYFLNKFFGIKLCFSVCFFFTIILSIIHDAPTLVLPEMMDLNLYDYKKTYLFSIFQYTNQNIGLVIAISFFCNGLYYCLIFYLISLTKTSFRCLFIGITSVFIKLNFFIIALFCIYVDLSIIFMSITSVIGLVITIFLNDSHDFNIIRDKKKLEVNNEEKET